MLEERIEIVHFHQCTSVMFHTSIRQCELMDIRTVYTDHSLMSLHSLEGILINKVLRCYSCNLDAFICVSHADCVNFMHRQNYSSKPENVYVIPNAVDARRFEGDFSVHPLVMNINNLSRQTDHSQHPLLTIVILSRLVYRKGVYLLQHIINQMLQEFSYIRFLIGGSGECEDSICNVATQWNIPGQPAKVLLMGEIEQQDVPAFLVGKLL